MPGFQKALVGYPPQATLPGMRQTFQWLEYNIDGTITYVLTHRLIAADGTARAVVQRQYYASTTYNGEQAVAGLLPAQGGRSSSAIRRARRTPQSFTGVPIDSGLLLRAAAYSHSAAIGKCRQGADGKTVSGRDLRNLSVESGHGT